LYKHSSAYKIVRYNLRCDEKHVSYPTIAKSELSHRGFSFLVVNYCEVTDRDIFDWWAESDRGKNRTTAAGAAGGRKTFLFGRDEDRGPNVSVIGRVRLNAADQVIFPLINARHRGNDRPLAKIEIENSTGYAKINGVDIPPANRHRKQASDGNADYDGFWVCVSGLSKGDAIEFGGTCPGHSSPPWSVSRPEFKTNASWTIE
jgi:hypothetical protein